MAGEEDGVKAETTGEGCSRMGGEGCSRVAGERYSIVDLGAIPAVPCPCGESRRAFAADPDGVASLHIVDIHEDSRLHWHARRTEIYYVLEGAGEVEVDGRRFAVRPGMAVKIRPGCRHRALGKIRILNAVIPAFDPDDERFD